MGNVLVTPSGPSGSFPGEGGRADGKSKASCHPKPEKKRWGEPGKKGSQAGDSRETTTNLACDPEGISRGERRRKKEKKVGDGVGEITVFANRLFLASTMNRTTPALPGNPQGREKLRGRVLSDSAIGAGHIVRTDKRLVLKGVLKYSSWGTGRKERKRGRAGEAD